MSDERPSLAGERLSLSDLPYDCKLEIAKYLDVKAVRSLRLTNRAMYGALSGPFFARFLERKTVDLERGSLDRLVHLVFSEKYRGVIRELRFRAAYCDLSQLKKQAKRAGTQASRSILAAAESRKKIQDRYLATGAGELLIFALKALGSVDTIRIELAFAKTAYFRPKSDLGELRKFGLQISDLIMTSIISSGINMQQLVIFDTTKPCSIDLFNFARVVQGAERSGKHFAVSQLKSFSARISTQPLDSAGRPRVDKSGQQFQPLAVNFLRFLSEASNLEHINITLYNPMNSNRLNIFTSQGLLTRFNWSRLQTCTLSGLSTKAVGLLDFLGHHKQLTSITLERIFLIDGDWSEVFNYLETKMPALKQVRLSYLMHNSVPGEAAREVNLFPCWEEKSRERILYYSRMGLAYSNGSVEMWVHTRDFNLDELKRGLVFWPLSPEGTGLHPDVIMARIQNGYWA
ncbi:hypothetical protein PDE_08483 [Penicillium oxalicum 114-2]|uniref:F-box domain-containing protein n=1 Tax=Penicillium oxalicum (strain 114-2 / CGMCC 5302) TaxID=933388 RepID=S7ZXL9_PENO1|nr:hypothetical protein PDE_08483 [Penicillium oxalicum 114-2]